MSVDIFQKSRGRRIVRAGFVRRFLGRTRAFGWNGRDRSGRLVSDGVFVVRFRVAVAGGRRDVVRVAVRRSRGRFVRLRSYNRRDSCGLVGKFKLSRPVFGGRRVRPLGIAYQLSRPGRAQVTVMRPRGRVVRRFAPTQVAAAKTQRLSLSARGRGRGRGAYRIQLKITRAGKTTTHTLTANRL